ncbi:hypothetical protein, partial [Clostridium perfringens]
MVLGAPKNPVHNFDYFTVKLAGGDVSATLTKMSAILRSVDPDNVFEYRFLDKQWDLLYREDKIRQTVF